MKTEARYDMPGVLYKFVCVPTDWDHDPFEVRIFRGRGATPWAAWKQLCETYLFKEMKKVRGFSPLSCKEMLDSLQVVAVFETNAEDQTSFFYVEAHDAEEKEEEEDDEKD